jgi:predicted RNase H-like HicB family nuclease
MVKILDFQVIFTLDEDGWYYVECPSIPGCHSQGETLEEARINIKDAVELCLKVAEDDLEYRSQIVFPKKDRPTFIGISDISVSKPAFL